MTILYGLYFIILVHVHDKNVLFYTFFHEITALFCFSKLEQYTDENMDKQLWKIIITIKYGLFLLFVDKEIVHRIISCYFHVIYHRELIHPDNLNVNQMLGSLRLSGWLWLARFVRDVGRALVASDKRSLVQIPARTFFTTWKQLTTDIMYLLIE